MLIIKSGCSGVFERENESTDGDSKDQGLLLYMGSEKRSRREGIPACVQSIRKQPVEREATVTEREGELQERSAEKMKKGVCDSYTDGGAQGQLFLSDRTRHSEGTSERVWWVWRQEEENDPFSCLAFSP